MIAAWSAGKLVRGTVTADGVALTALSTGALSGTVNSDATRAAGLTLAEDGLVLDTLDGSAVRVAREALAGLTLSRDNVRAYVLNARGEISHLILKDATGALWRYGFLSAAEIQQKGGTSLDFTARYEYWLDGKKQTWSSNGKSFSVTAGTGVAIRLGAGNTVEGMKSLASTTLTAAAGTKAYTANQSFDLASDVQVLLKLDGAYYSVTLDDLQGKDYTLTGWYDSVQKQIRVILAK